MPRHDRGQVEDLNPVILGSAPSHSRRKDVTVILDLTWIRPLAQETLHGRESFSLAIPSHWTDFVVQRLDSVTEGDLAARRRAFQKEDG
jgi:hypothetical protein